jgi:hypothetical protein
MRQSSWSNLAAAKMVQVCFPAPVEYRCPAFSRAASHHGLRRRPFLHCGQNRLSCASSADKIELSCASTATKIELSCASTATKILSANPHG